MSDCPAGYVSVPVEAAILFCDNFIERRTIWRERKKERFIRNRMTPTSTSRKKFWFFGPDEVTIHMTTRQEAEKLYDVKPERAFSRSQKEYDELSGYHISGDIDNVRAAAVYAKQQGVENVLISVETLSRGISSFTQDPLAD